MAVKSPVDPLTKNLPSLPAPMVLGAVRFIAAWHGAAALDGDEDAERKASEAAREAVAVLESLADGVRPGALLPYVDALSLMHRIGYGRAPQPEAELRRLRRVARAPKSDDVEPHVRAWAIARMWALKPDEVSAAELGYLTEVADRLTAEAAACQASSARSASGGDPEPLLQRLIFLASLSGKLSTEATRSAVRLCFDRVKQLPFTALPTATLAAIHTLSGFMGEPDAGLLRLLARREDADGYSRRAYVLELKMLTD